MDIVQQVAEWVKEKIADREDLFLVDIAMQPYGKLLILVDGDKGISIQDCASISRYIGFRIEEENLIDHAYHLEVSSPGVNYPLQQLRQYQKNIGRSVVVQLNDTRKQQGKLIEVNNKGITIEENIKNKGVKSETLVVSIPFEQIKETKVLISFK